ncbi:hypothetical protein JXR93_04045 [bacterium]|nr:hypothetical protein [bacterium]
MRLIKYIIPLLFTFVLWGNSEDVTIEIKGEAAILSGDKVAAKDKAIDDALRKSVEQVSGTVVSSDSLTENFELVSDRIYTKSKGYVKKYSVVEEGVDSKDPNIYFVKISATVSTKQLKEDIDAIKEIYKNIGKPKIMILISEQNVGQKTASGWWTGNAIDLGTVESSILKYFTEKGFKFIDHQVLSKELKVLPAFQNVNNLSEKDIKKISNMHDADFIIYGQAIASTLTNTTGFNVTTVSSTMTVRVVRADTGEIIFIENDLTEKGTSNANDEIMAGKKSFQKLGASASKKIENAILKKWQQLLTAPNDIEVVIKGNLKYQIAKKFIAFLKDEVRGVVDASDIKITNKNGEFTLTYKGFTKHFVDEVLNKPFKELPLAVDSITRNKVVFSIEK